MSNYLPYQPNTCQVPNVIIDYWMHQLTDTQFKVLMVITRKTLGWGKIRDHISSSQIEKLTGFGSTAVRSAIIKLQALELIEVMQHKQADGVNLPNTFQLKFLVPQESVIPPAETTPPSPVQPTPPPPVQPTPQKTKTKPTNLKGIVLDEDQTLPFKEEEKNKTKFPLKKEQRPYYERMRDLDLGSNDGTLIILVREAFKSNKVHMLDKAISHIQAEREKGTFFKKPPIALFRSVLDGKVSPISENAKINKKYALGAKKKANWTSLEVKDKFAACDVCHKEIPLDMDPASFQEYLKQVYEHYKNYAGN